MNKLVHVLIICTIFLIFGICSFIGGYFYHAKTVKPEVKVITETKWKHSIIYRDYTVLTQDEVITRLKCYDQSEMYISVNPLESAGTYRISTSLCERKAERDFEVECGESGNFKLYLGFGLATAAGVGLFALLH